MRRLTLLGVVPLIFIGGAILAGGDSAVAPAPTGDPVVGAPAAKAGLTDRAFRLRLAKAQAPPRRNEPDGRVTNLQNLLADSSLTREEQAQVHLALAQVYEQLPNEGETARKTYADIRDRYAGDPVSLEAAHRFGTLYHSIILRGTNASYPDAVKQFEYVIERAEPGSLVALKSRMSLGNLGLVMREPAKAIAQFEAIYDLKPDALAVPVELAALPPDQRDSAMKGVRNDFERMKARLLVKMVTVCKSMDAEEKVPALRALLDRYPTDAAVRALVAPALSELGVSLSAGDQP